MMHGLNYTVWTGHANIPPEREPIRKNWSLIGEFLEKRQKKQKSLWFKEQMNHPAMRYYRQQNWLRMNKGQSDFSSLIWERMSLKMY